MLKESGQKKNISQGELAEKLARGNEIVKQVYRQVQLCSEICVLSSLYGFDSELPNYDLIVPALLAHGVDGLRAACKLTPGEQYR